MSAYVTYGTFSFSADSGYPVPQVSLNHQQDRDGAGKSIGSKTVVTLEGLIYPPKSQPSGSFGYITGREDNLRTVFKKDGQLLVIGCSDKPYFSGHAQINRYSADKTDNYWLSTIAYTIELEINATGVPSSGIFAVSSTQDEVNIETIEEFSFVGGPYPGIRGPTGTTEFLNQPFSGYPVYRISRTLSAVGKYLPNETGGKSPIANAKEWVNHRVSNNNTLSSYLSGLNVYNFTRSVSLNEPEGSYRITDNWLATSQLVGTYTESFNVESSLDNAMLRTTVINGTVKGLEAFSHTTPYSSGIIGTGLSGSLYPTYSGSRSGNSRFSNALNGYSAIKMNLYNRANAFIEPVGGFGLQQGSGNTIRTHFSRNEPILNPIPISVTEGYNPPEGSVTYSYTYNNRPLNMVSGSLSEVLTVEDNLPTQQIVELFVLGRRLGPVIQDLGTITAPTRNVVFEVVMPRPSSLSGVKLPSNVYSAITGLVESLNPTYLLASNTSNNSPIQYFVKTDTENWGISEGRFVKTKQWVWTKCT